MSIATATAPAGSLNLPKVWLNEVSDPFLMARVFQLAHTRREQVTPQMVRGITINQGTWCIAEMEGYNEWSSYQCVTTDPSKADSFKICYVGAAGKDWYRCHPHGRGYLENWSEATILTVTSYACHGRQTLRDCPLPFKLPALALRLGGVHNVQVDLSNNRTVPGLPASKTGRPIIHNGPTPVATSSGPNHFGRAVPATVPVGFTAERVEADRWKSMYERASRDNDKNLQRYRGMKRKVEIADDEMTNMAKTIHHQAHTIGRYSALAAGRRDPGPEERRDHARLRTWLRSSESVASRNLGTPSAGGSSTGTFTSI